MSSILYHGQAMRVGRNVYGITKRGKYGEKSTGYGQRSKLDLCAAGRKILRSLYRAVHRPRADDAHCFCVGADESRCGSALSEQHVRAGIAVPDWRGDCVFDEYHASAARAPLEERVPKSACETDPTGVPDVKRRPHARNPVCRCVYDDSESAGIGK